MLSPVLGLVLFPRQPVKLTPCSGVFSLSTYRLQTVAGADAQLRCLQPSPRTARLSASEQVNGVEVSHAARGGVMIQGRMNMSQIVGTGDACGDPDKEKTGNRIGVSPLCFTEITEVCWFKHLELRCRAQR